ncbi:MAG: glycosyltransferase family 2 protein [Candidatus Omnitrophica bacterium]|nr:glycosyltransferase family 2 protein [Candidatus Omnitrophota bacterium]
MTRLDIVIPVYNEGRGILAVLDSLRRGVRTSFRVLICYDHDGDTTLAALREAPHPDGDVLLVKNRGVGPHAAVLSGFEASAAPAVLVYPADDTYNAGIIDQMVQQCEAGCRIVSASRLMPGGRMVGCPWLKDLLVRVSAFTLYHLAGVPTRDASNGLRLFSRRVLETIAIESTQGFTYSIELLVKCHRLRWKVGEVPAAWFARPTGASRFQVIRWLPAYLRWYGYAFATTYARRTAASVALRTDAKGAPTPHEAAASARQASSCHAG